MFDVFGEFDSAMEINMAAEGLKEEGDIENLRKLAEENGLQYYVEDYIAGLSDELCDVITAAIGKLSVEREAAKEWSIIADDIIGYLESNCDDIDFAAAVRKKDKRVEKVALIIMETAKKQRQKIGNSGGQVGYCGMMQGYQLIKEYYQEGAK